jgi:hypothetical protein
MLAVTGKEETVIASELAWAELAATNIEQIREQTKATREPLIFIALLYSRLRAISIEALVKLSGSLTG